MRNGKTTTATLAELDGLRARIRQWRQMRPRTRPMPEALWSESSRAASRHGIWPVARELRINHGALKKRVTAMVERSRRDQAITGVEVASVAPQFIELRGIGRPEPGALVQTVVEMVAPDGARLTIRLAGANPDVAGMLTAFRVRP